MRKSGPPIARREPGLHPRCRRCLEPLILERSQISPPRWGPALITEWYSCPACDALYAYAPADDRWRLIIED